MISKEKTFTAEELRHRENLVEFYSSEDGIKELSRRLVDFCFFRPIRAEEVAMRNYGVAILEELGVFDQDKIEDVVRALLNLPILKNADKKKADGEVYREID